MPRVQNGHQRASRQSAPMRGRSTTTRCSTLITTPVSSAGLSRTRWPESSPWALQPWSSLPTLTSVSSSFPVLSFNLQGCMNLLSLSFFFEFIFSMINFLLNSFVEPLSTKAFNGLERYIRVLYRGQSIFSLESTTKLHYEEPNLVPHVILRYLRELPRSLLTVSDAVALSGSAATSHLVDLYVDSMKPKPSFLCNFLRFIYYSFDSSSLSLFSPPLIPKLVNDLLRSGCSLSF